MLCVSYSTETKEAIDTCLKKKKSKSNDNDNEILKIHQGVPEIHTYIFPMILYCKNNYRTYMIKETKKKKRGSSSK